MPRRVAALQLVLDDHALLAGQRAVVGLHQLDPGVVRLRPCAAALLVGVQLVEPGGEALGLTAGVGEDDGGAVREDLFEDARVDARPDAACARGRRGRPGRCGCRVDRGLPSSPMSSTGTTTSTSSGLADAGVDDGDGPRARRSSVWPPRKWATSSSGRCVADSPMRCGGALVICSSRSSVSIEVRAALGGRERVDLVDDHRLDVDQRLARRRGEHQVEALGRGDEQVGRAADEAPGGPWPTCRRCAWPPTGSMNASPSRSAARPMPISGERRFFSTSNASARSGEM